MYAMRGVGGFSGMGSSGDCDRGVIGNVDRDEMEESDVELVVCGFLRNLPLLSLGCVSLYESSGMSAA